MRAVKGAVVQACCSQLILAEYRSVLNRPRFDSIRAQMSAVLDVVAQAELFDPHSSGMTSPDPRDTPFIDCAVAAKADYLVTGNKRHFPEQTYGGTTVVNARQLLDLLLPTP